MSDGLNSSRAKHTSYVFNGPVDLWVVSSPDSNPWTPLIDWRLGFWHSRTARSPMNGLKWDSTQPLLMATPAGLASPRILYWPGQLSTQSEFEDVLKVIEKLKTTSVLFLVERQATVGEIETWSRRFSGQGFSLKAESL